MDSKAATYQTNFNRNDFSSLALSILISGLT